MAEKRAGVFIKRTPGLNLLEHLSLIAVFLFLTPVYDLASSPPRGYQEEATGRSAEKNSPAVILTPNNKIESEISSGKRAEYVIELKAGEFLSMDFCSMGTDLLVTVVTPGREAHEWYVARGSPQPVAFIADLSGIYRMQVSILKGDFDRQRSYLEVLSVRKATMADRKRATGSQILSEGVRLHRELTAAALKKSLDKFREALQIARLLNDGPQQVSLFCHIADVYVDFSEFDQALGAYAHALSLCRNMKARSQILNSMGEVYRGEGERSRALECFNDALKASRVDGDPWTESRSIHNLGVVYYDMDNLKLSQQYLNDALLLRRSIHDSLGTAETLVCLGYTFHLQKDLQKAGDYYQQALSLWQKTDDLAGKSSALVALGHLMNISGEWQKALTYFDDAIGYWRRIGNRTWQNSILQGRAYAFCALREKEECLAQYQQSAEISHNLRNAGVESNTLAFIAQLYWELGNHAEAIRFCQRALQLNQQVSSVWLKSTVLMIMGKVYEQERQIEKAQGLYKEALDLCRTAKDRFLEATLLNALGTTFRATRQNQKALQYFRQALALQQETGDTVGVSDAFYNMDTFYNMAVAERDIGDLDAALSHVGEAIRSAESVRTRLASLDLRASYQASVNEIHKTAIDLLMQSPKSGGSAGSDAAALQASEKARARSLLESLIEAKADIRQGVDPSLLERERSLQQTLNARAEQQMRLLSGKHTEEQAAALSKEISNLSTEYTEVQALIRGNSPRYAALTQPQPLTVPQIQQEVLDPETLLLEYSLGDERSYLWAVTSTSLRSYQLPRKSDIESIARRVNALISSSQPQAGGMVHERQTGTGETERQFRQEAAALSRIVLGPAAELLGTKRLLIVAEGALQYVPFSALPEPGGKTGNPGAEDAFSPLIVKHEVVNLPSASVLAVLRRETQQRASPAKMIAVLADPVFESDDPRLARKKSNPKVEAEKLSREQAGPARAAASRAIASSASGNLTTRLQRAFRDVGTRGQFNIPRLPATREEAEAILGFTPPELNLKALDFQASRETATSSVLSQYRVIHFATHGLLDSEKPELSGLVLSLFDEDGRPQNGFLRLDDIYNLNLPVNLVVLSACNSGLGKEIRGEGLVGIVRGFMYAGAARVVASLWKVEDEATAELMKRFYRHMFQDGEPASAALRSAQIEMLQQKRWSYPYFWAAFILQGEWK